MDEGGASSAQSLTSQIFAWPTGAAFLLGIGLTLLVQRLVRRRASGRIEARTAGPEAAVGPRAMTDVT